MQGWISIHRQIQEKGWYKDSEYVHLWIHLLMKCNHKEKEFLWNGTIKKIERGQCVTGRKKLSEETNISESKIQRILKCFESEQQIEQQTNNKYRLITVLKYDEYQTGEQQIEQPVNNKRTASEQPVNTNNNDNNVNNDNNSITNVIEAKPKYGNEDINWVLEKFEQHFGYESQGSKQKDRYCAKHLLNNYERLQIEGMMIYCNTYEYAPRIGSVQKLWYKRGDVIAGIKQEQTKINNKGAKLITI